ncbi:thioesterase superfamily protein [Alcanivorax xiamenensis]|uniref:Thioesterase superfamily protein n=1 Tax=Alcanivorax xiamenensis TaxID=1177156 RepID=A0ABQ6Y3P4_9GAMM|nr:MULTISPECIES: PaaI family thioesterase [Alcanivorax]KAF0803091.1 thioesterase superfamily protein [Alcanivorax xiamenensis]
MNENQNDQITQRQAGFLPGYMGLQWDTAERGLIRGHFSVARHHLAPNGYLHAASVIALADSACGFGCQTSLPEGAISFTTVELKSNFIGTAREGVVTCEAKAVHLGRTTQLWDAEVRHQDSGKVIALFRCTQMVLYPKG